MELLSLNTTDISGWIIPLCEGWPVHCRLFSSVPGQRPPHASSIHSPTPDILTKISPDNARCSRWGQSCLWLRTTAFRRKLSIHTLKEERILTGDRRKNSQKKKKRERNQTSKSVYPLLFYSSSELRRSLKGHGLVFKQTAVVPTCLV